MKAEECTKEELILVLQRHYLIIDGVDEVAILSHRARKAGKRAIEFLEKSNELLKSGNLEASKTAYDRYVRLSDAEDKIMKEMERLVYE